MTPWGQKAIEDVARAICNPELAGPVVQDIAMPRWHEITERERQRHLFEARAAIAAFIDALREPSEEMIEAAYTARGTSLAAAMNKPRYHPSDHRILPETDLRAMLTRADEEIRS